MKVPDSPQGAKAALPSVLTTTAAPAAARPPPDGAARDRVSSELGGLVGGTAQARHSSRFEEVRRALEAGLYRVDAHAVADALSSESSFAAGIRSQTAI